MSRIVRIGARKLPTILGAGILGVALFGLAAASLGFSLSLLGEVVSAAAGMAIGGKYS